VTGATSAGRKAADIHTAASIRTQAAKAGEVPLRTHDVMQPLDVYDSQRRVSRIT
jgi:hypothetical protein